MNKSQLMDEITLCKTSISNIVDAFKAAPTVTIAEFELTTLVIEGWMIRYNIARSAIEAL